MSQKAFESFSEAKNFAKQNYPSQILRDGNQWVVTFEGGRGNDASQSAELREVKRELADAQVTIGNLNRELKLADRELSILTSNLSEKVNAQVKDMRSKLREQRIELESELDEERRKLVTQQDKLSQSELACRQKMEKLERLRSDIDVAIKALKERFGDFEVATVVNEHLENFFCSQCGGDGGIRGRCPRCFGTGWEERHVFDGREKVVKFKEDET